MKRIRKSNFILNESIKNTPEKIIIKKETNDNYLKSNNNIISLHLKNFNDNNNNNQNNNTTSSNSQWYCCLWKLINNFSKSKDDDCDKNNHPLILCDIMVTKSPVVEINNKFYCIDTNDVDSKYFLSSFNNVTDKTYKLISNNETIINNNEKNEIEIYRKHALSLKNEKRNKKKEMKTDKLKQVWLVIGPFSERNMADVIKSIWKYKTKTFERKKQKGEEIANKYNLNIWREDNFHQLSLDIEKKRIHNQEIFHKIWSNSFSIQQDKEYQNAFSSNSSTDDNSLPDLINNDELLKNYYKNTLK
jgi:hypothetical protein